MADKFWCTKKGVLVKQDGPEVEGKILCYRYPEGGFHGRLWIKNLTPATPEGSAWEKVPGGLKIHPSKSPAKPKGRTLAELGKAVDKAIDLAVKERAQVAMLLEQTRLLREEIGVARNFVVHALLSDLRRVIGQSSARAHLDCLWGVGTVARLMGRIDDVIGEGPR